MMTARPEYNRNACILLGFVMAFALFILFFNLGGRTLENQDNYRFAEIAREILETGDWVMMRLGGEIYVDKPPLHFWNTALSYKLFGVGPFAARFPAALFSLLGLAGILFFGSVINRENPKTWIYAALFLISNYEYAYYSRTARIDMEYSVLFSISLISFYAGYSSLRRNRKMLSYLLFWIFMGMTFLEKGPVAFITLLIVLIFVLIQRQWDRLRWKMLAAMFPALFATILPWIILLFMHRDFERYADLLKSTTIMTRSAGFFYYIPTFFKKFFPGSVFMLLSLPALWRQRDRLRKHPGLVFCLTWSAVYLLLIQMTDVKNHRYLMPVFIPFSVITAWGTELILSGKTSSSGLWRRWKTPAGILAGFVCLAPSAWIWIYKGWMWGPLFFSMAGFFSFLMVWKGVKDMVIFICIFCAMSFLSVDLVRTTFNTQVSDKLRLYTMLREHDIQAGDVLLYQTPPKLKRLLSFYFDRLLRQKEDAFEAAEDGIRAVVTHPATTDEVLRAYGPDARTAVIENHRGKDDLNFIVVFPVPR